MKRTHPAFWGAGWAGVAVGGLMTVIGLVDASETAHLAGGYGLLVMASAVYLLGGLGLRRTLANRAARSQAPAASSVGSRATANQA
jgi:hypothetical protein